MFTLISLPPALRLRLQVHSTTRPGLFTKDNVKIAEICIDVISMSRPQRVGKGKQCGHSNMLKTNICLVSL
jgi:hypothetical protein